MMGFSHRLRAKRLAEESTEKSPPLDAMARRDLLDAFLRDHPPSSVILEQGDAPICFQEPAIQSMWDRFDTIAGTIESWASASLAQKLYAFALTMQHQSWQEDYHQQKDWIEQIKQAVRELEEQEAPH
jgi:hypothetical protein